MSDGTRSGLPSVRWDPRQYLRFDAPRLRPALDLLRRLDHLEPRRIVDLGCGTGELTRRIAARWPEAEVVGFDRSPEMLARARHGDGPEERIVWTEGDIAEWQPPEPIDLVFSNAALHWLPAHAALFPRLAAALAPGGALAIQMPLSFPLPSHRLMREVLAEGDGGRPFGGEELRRRMAAPPVLDSGAYFDLLVDQVAEIDLWETEYLQVLRGEEAVLEWVRGTGLRPILEGLDEPERTAFLTRYRQRLLEAYPPRADGTTLYPFRRLFLYARV